MPHAVALSKHHDLAALRSAVVVQDELLTTKGGAFADFDQAIGDVLGDVDAAVPVEEFDVADGALRQAGFVVEHADDFTNLHALLLSEGKEQRGHFGVVVLLG